MTERPIPHGLNGYVNHGCRCDICSTARREYDNARVKQSRKTCLVTGCENPVAPRNGSRGRFPIRCEDHNLTCIIPDCDRRAPTPRCTFHRNVKSIAKRREKGRIANEKREIEEAVALLKEHGYDVFEPARHAYVDREQDKMDALS